MVIIGKHQHVGPARKSRLMGILFSFLGVFLLFSFFLLYTSFTQRQRPHLVDTAAAFPTDSHRVHIYEPTLGGLLPNPELYEKGQCVSRLEESFIREPSLYIPSPYLVAKLRKYEDQHRKCAGKATKFNKGEGQNSREELGDCKFVVWIANSGLGNRMITISSAFVYSLLTDRVLLLDHSGTDVGGLFCEPFPGTSWLLPDGFDYDWLGSVYWENTNRLGLLLQKGGPGGENFTIPPNNYVFLNLMHDYDLHDQKFFCNRTQKLVKEVPLLYLRSNNYFVPGLHFIPKFHEELDKMFPERDATFHHISRYLFRPSNLMWGLILRFRQPYLASAQRQVGLQLRILESNITLSIFADQLMSCVLEKKILPHVTNDTEDSLQRGTSSSTAIVVTSLDHIYYEKLRDYYLEQPSEAGEFVGVYSPSKEEMQQYGFSHDKKAWADMYLLSLSDTLVTSPWSTFGYIAQALSGLTPWILTKSPSLETAEETLWAQGPCNRGVSLEPCFHSPPELDCNGRGRGPYPGTILPFIKPCEDVNGGVKIMPSRSSNVDDNPEQLV